MTRRTLISLLLIALVASSAALAGTAGRMTAEVPFDFLVNGKKLPAGEYTLTETAAGVLQLRNAEGRAAAVLTRTTDYGLDRTESKLVFNNFSGQHVLAEFQARGTSRKIPGAGKAVLLAMNADEQPIVVAVALNRR